MAARPNAVIFECPEPLRNRLEAYTDRTGLTRSEVIRTALNDYLTAKETTMNTEITITAADTEWANEQIEAIEPTKSAVRAFDASADGLKFRAIAGMTMWANLGGDTLPETAEED